MSNEKTAGPGNEEKKDEVAVNTVTPTLEIGAEEETTTSAYPGKWQEIVGSFAEKVGRDIKDISKAFEGVVGEPGDEALGYLADPVNASDVDIKEALKEFKIPTAKLNANIAILRGPKPVKTVSSDTASPQNIGLDILPQIPDDESFLQLLKIGGELKIGPTEVLSAVKSALANRVHLYDLPEKLKNAMEEFAEKNDEPCGPEYYKLRKEVTKRSYAEVLSVLDVEGTFVTQGRKKNLFEKLDNFLWPSVFDFKEQLIGWQSSWLEGASGQAMNLAMLSMATSGPGNALPPGMIAPPETDGIRDAAEGVIDNINKVFSGTNIPVARALAYDASKIKNFMENPGLPGLIGAANKEQMLKMLDADVTSDFIRLERNIVKFIMAIMEIDKVDASAELVYFPAMTQLAKTIPWDKLMRDERSNSKSNKHEKY